MSRLYHDLDNADYLLGESQPVYDEFGAILLLILAFRYRLNLTAVELGAGNSSSFVNRLIASNSTPQKVEELDERMTKHLGAWISALFIAEELSDELTSSCSPQEYYLLVPALLSQSLEACESGKLSLEILKSGFECWCCNRGLIIGANEDRFAGAFLASISGYCDHLVSSKYLGVE